MYIHGEFLTKKGDVVLVQILTKNDRSKEIEIGKDENAEIYFSDSPLKIESQVNDTFDVLLMTQATLSLEVRNFISDFFCASCFDALVNIYKAGKCIFAGFIEPQTYSQGFNDLYDSVELSCIDVITALEYRSYKDIIAPTLSYDVAKINAKQRTFREVLTSTLQFFTSRYAIANNVKSRVWYDGSKAIDNKAENAFNIFTLLSIFDLLFFEDDADSVWKSSEVITELLKYLNLHIVQIGLDFYIFSWETIKVGGSVSWRDIVSGEVATTTAKEVEINIDNVTGCDTKINVGQVYSVVSLKCDVQKLDDVIESPLSDNSLKSRWSSAQKYMLEYDSYGRGNDSFSAFISLTKGSTTTYDSILLNSWYAQAKYNKNWLIGAKGEDLSAKFGGNNTNQQDVFNYLAKNPSAAIVAFGSLDMMGNKQDNGLKSKIEMENYLVLSVNGNGDDTEVGVYPKDSDIKANIPYAVYNGNYAGGALSPADEASTNYIVISGDIILNSPPELSATYKYMHNTDALVLLEEHSRFRGIKLSHRADGTEGYYTQQFFKAETPFAEEKWDENVEIGLSPYLKDRSRKKYEFKFSAIGDRQDTISKVGILACMLIVGDKCAVEVAHTGGISDFQWQKYKTLEECQDEDEYFAQSFTIGVDPKIGDSLIGTSFKIQNNISYKLGIDAEGTAIPIRKSDGLFGRVQFKILGPVNAMWDDITREHPTFFRHTHFTEKSIPLLAHVSSIMIRRFEMKIYNDNGLINNTEDKDLVYMSAENDGFTNKKDDIEFKIYSALTQQERVEFNINDVISSAVPLDETSHTPITAVYNRRKGEKIKPEIDYIDSYYREYSAPRVVLQQSLVDDESIVSPFNIYKHPALQDKKMFVQAVDHDVLEGEATLTIKEIDK